MKTGKMADRQIEEGRGEERVEVAGGVPESEEGIKRAEKSDVRLTWG